MFHRRTKFIKPFLGQNTRQTNILVVEIKQANVARKKQQLLGFFTSN